MYSSVCTIHVPYVLYVLLFFQLSAKIIAYIHLRFSDAFPLKYNEGQAFGGVNILVTGDLLQLGPVRGQFCYELLDKKVKQNAFNAYSLPYNLWTEEFDYYELTENVRQQGDSSFAEMLNRLFAFLSSD